MGGETIPAEKAWRRVAKMILPGEKPPWQISTRDGWLIDHYLAPGAEPDNVVDGYPRPELKSRPVAPPALVNEVDRAYYRLSLQQKVDQWFEARGFDLSQPTISKEEFERRLVDCHIAPAVTPKPREKPASNADLADFIKNYKGSRTEKALGEALTNAGISVTRERLRAALPGRRPGRPNKSPK